MSDLLSKLRGESTSSSTGQLPKGHVPIDWSKWTPPGEGDVRSPCPAVNALANHGILPHNGKNITKAMAAEALTRAYNLAPHIASVFAAGAVAANPDHSAHTFDLNHVDKHGYIEHDVSLSRDDIAFGSNSKFSKEVFDKFMKDYESSIKASSSPDSATTNWHAAAEVRYGRVLASKDKHEKQGKTWTYGIKEAIMSYGETGLYMSLLGKDGVAPLQWIRIFFEEERLPYKEGWRPPSKIDQSTLNHAYFEMVKANKHGHDEAKMIGMGTFEALRETILSLGASLVKGPTPKQ